MAGTIINYDNTLQLYEAQSNGMNYIILRDMDRGHNDSTIIDWDLSDSEIDDLVSRFESGEYSDIDVNGDAEWDDFDLVADGLWDVRHIW